MKLSLSVVGRMKKTVDRYEGRISFENNLSENFTINLDPIKCKQIINICMGEIGKSADDLQKRMHELLLK